jgi:RimJ/RimL family protein N-acetyltransferase
VTGAVVTIPELETDRLLMRCPAEADLEPLAAFHATDRAAFVGGAMSRIDCWKQLTSAIGHWHFRGWGRWTCVERRSGKAAGIVGLHAPEGWPEPEIAWTIFGGFEGKGLAFEAARAARRYAYEVAGWTTAISLIDPANARSAALARRLGATLEGRFDHETYGAMDIWRHPGPETGA